MVLYPDVMKKAQAELDAVVGRDRVPTFEDHEDLPYIRAMVKEVLRWRPILPLGAFYFSEYRHVSLLNMSFISNSEGD